MVAVNPNLTLTLEALGPHGALIPAEVKVCCQLSRLDPARMYAFLTLRLIQVALSHSLPLKEAELGVSGLTLWGRLQALNGKDYLIAQASESMHVIDNAVHSSTIYLFSQDGIDWATLGTVTPANRKTAANMLTMLSGDPQKKHYWPPKPEDQEEDAGAVLLWQFTDGNLWAWL